MPARGSHYVLGDVLDAGEVALGGVVLLENPRRIAALALKL